MEYVLKEWLGLGPVALLVLAVAGFFVYWKLKENHVRRSVQETEDMILRMAEAGDSVACFRMGRKYQNGEGVDQDSVVADEWFQKALPGLRREADEGYEAAAACLYECYHEGIVVGSDQAQALHWLKMAAELGDVECQLALALEYRTGGLVEKDSARFIHWLHLAADGVEGSVQYMMGGDAQYLLGACYEYGEGVPQDLEKAREWYRKAEDNLADGAEEALKRLGGK